MVETTTTRAFTDDEAAFLPISQSVGMVSVMATSRMMLVKERTQILSDAQKHGERTDVLFLFELGLGRPGERVMHQVPVSSKYNPGHKRIREMKIE